MNKDVTVILCVAKEDEKYLEEKIGKYAKFPIVISRTVGLGKARRECIDKVTTPYCLILDLDTVLPDEYLDYALWILHDNNDVAVVAIDYEKLQGHLAIGTSVWRTKILKKLYDYQNYKGELCECVFMLHKVLQNNYKIETLNYRAIHLKEK